MNLYFKVKYTLSKHRNIAGVCIVMPGESLFRLNSCEVELRANSQVANSILTVRDICMYIDIKSEWLFAQILLLLAFGENSGIRFHFTYIRISNYAAFPRVT